MHEIFIVAFLRAYKMDKVKISRSRCDDVCAATNPILAHPKGVQSGQADDVNSVLYPQLRFYSQRIVILMNMFLGAKNS